MRFTTKPRAIEARSTWHPWFAWRPVWIEPGVWAWMETVERRVLSMGFRSLGEVYREYRFPAPDA